MFFIKNKIKRLGISAMFMLIILGIAACSNSNGTSADLSIENLIWSREDGIPAERFVLGLVDDEEGNRVEVLSSFDSIIVQILHLGSSEKSLYLNKFLFNERRLWALTDTRELMTEDEMLEKPIVLYTLTGSSFEVLDTKYNYNIKTNGDIYRMTITLRDRDESDILGISGEWIAFIRTNTDITDSESEVLDNDASTSWTPQSWTSKLPGEWEITNATIPGTHDAAAFNSKVDDPATINMVHTQDKNLMQQLEAGIRYFDCRLGSGDKSIDYLRFFHGNYNLELTLDDAMQTFRTFLSRTESKDETILVQVSPEHDDHNRPFYERFREQTYLDSRYSDLWYTGQTIPTFSQVRGKIVLLRNYEGYSGIDMYSVKSQNSNTIWEGRNPNGTTFHFQDLYMSSKLFLSEIVDDKYNAILRAINYALNYKNSERFFINFWSHAYRVVPANGPKYYAGEINKRMNTQRANYFDRTRIPGVQLMDFFWPDNVRSVIGSNFMDSNRIDFGPIIGGARNLKGDNDVNSQSNRDTKWELHIDWARIANERIQLNYTYKVEEVHRDYTTLEITGSRDVYLGYTPPADSGSQTLSGTVRGKQNDWLTFGYGSGLIRSASIMIDSSSSDDRNHIGFRVNLYIPKSQVSYTVTLSSDGTGASGWGNYYNGDRVNINAGAIPYYRFTGWTTTNTPWVYIANPNNVSTYFIMPPNHVSVTANFEAMRSTFTDTRDGQIYYYAIIGTQTWMAQNLNYKPADGTSWCYDDDESYCADYGRLYTWDTAMAGASSSSASPSGVRGVCPPGWHLPSDADWMKLAAYAGHDNSARDTSGTRLKSPMLWLPYTGIPVGTNDYGFSALPGGARGPLFGGFFTGVGELGSWWTATEYSANNAWNWSVSYDSPRMHLEQIFKSTGYSVRCVKD